VLFRSNALRYRLKESRSMALENQTPERSQLGTALAALIGLESAPQALPLRSWLGIARRVVERRKSAADLTASLTRYLGVPVRLVPLVGAWRNIEACDRTTLGRANHTLGQRTVLGSRVWDQAARIRLVIGPLDYALFRRLLPPLPQQPGDTLYEGLVALVRLLTDRRHDCEISLEVKAETVGDSNLTAAAGEGGNTGLRLGATAWLTRPHDAPHAEYLIPAYGPVMTAEARA
jgi:type VI secretion system protein ImpH